jgi:hypothetical protein
MWELLWAGTEMSTFEKTAFVAELASNESTRAGCEQGMKGYVQLFPG